MSEKIRRGFSKSINWNITTDKKSTEKLNENTKTIAKELDNNPVPNQNELNPDKK